MQVFALSWIMASQNRRESTTGLEGGSQKGLSGYEEIMAVPAALPRNKLFLGFCGSTQSDQTEWKPEALSLGRMDFNASGVVLVSQTP